MTIASTTARPRSASHRREVTVKEKLLGILRPGRKQTARRATPFDGELLDRKREDVYVVMYQIGLIR